eukprot:TRINITY_DN20072_c0_g1_i1.p1 TRINITY_DN20072_c0_g1~~TRINITY_DN20072_c0_g1_i1.p1  ORF type:complete len:137 (-),score=8.85 TRINITY_DN20072_c0_g1_i1:154-564(-)
MSELHVTVDLSLIILNSATKHTYKNFVKQIDSRVDGYALEFDNATSKQTCATGGHVNSQGGEEAIIKISLRGIVLKIEHEIKAPYRTSQINASNSTSRIRGTLFINNNGEIILRKPPNLLNVEFVSRAPFLYNLFS